MNTKKKEYETVLSSRTIEAAMIAQLMRDAVDKECQEAVVHSVLWERDDGKRIPMMLKVHPSFPNEKVCLRRLSERIEILMSGEKPGVDKNAILRLQTVQEKESMHWDLSMESFDRAVLSDEGLLTIALGLSNGVSKEAMNLSGSTRLRLIGAQGHAVSRKQCLEEIQKTVQRKRKEKMDLVRKLARQEDALIHQQKEREERQEREEEGGLVHFSEKMSEWIDEQGGVPVRSTGPLREAVEKRWEAARVNDAQEEVSERESVPQDEGSGRANGNGNVGNGMGQVFEKAKNETTAWTSGTFNPNDGEGLQETVHKTVEGKTISSEKENTRGGRERLESAEEPVLKQVEATKENSSRHAVEASKIEKGIESEGGEGIQEGGASVSMIERLRGQGGSANGGGHRPSQATGWFPGLEPGWDEMLITMNKERFEDLTQELLDWEAFELRIIHKEEGVWSVGIATPSDYFKKAMGLGAQFAQGGVMIRRSKK